MNKMNFFIAALVCLSFTRTGVHSQDCNGNLVQALQQCAGSISAGESLSLQQQKCAPGGCNYDCPSSDRLTSLENQVQQVTTMVQTLQEHIEHPCGSAGWTRIAYLDMTDPSINCPDELQLYTSGATRACGRKSSNTGSCNSLLFPSNGTAYKEVCGRVYGYQKGTTQAIFNAGLGLESTYVDGVSLTYGSSPRKHIWTFMASFKDHGFGTWECPCQVNANFGNVASFIGDDYFCESGCNTGQNPAPHVLFFDDLLWDGEQCFNRESPCCQIPGLPWFTRTLEASTTEDIELRVCANEGTDNEDSPVSLYEIYIK